MPLRSAVVAIALAVSTGAQAAESLLQALVPHPLGVVITVGRWLINSGERVYEVEVEGMGDTLDQARENGHRLAVQQAVGSLNLRQTERQGDQIVQDRQIIYSSGFVQDWRETRSYRNSRGQWVMVMTVRVRHSSIADGLVGQTQPGSTALDGTQQSRVIQSRDREQQDAARLLEAVLEKWPLQALQIEHQPARTSVTPDGHVKITIPEITILWDPAHRKSLYETLDRISLKTRGEFWSMWAENKYWLPTQWAIRTQQHHELLDQAFRRPVELRVRFMQGSTLISQRCGETNVYLYGGGSRRLPLESLTIKNLVIYMDRAQLGQINGVVLDLVAPNMCR